MTATSSCHLLFPIDPSKILTGFTTSPTISLPNVAHVSLDDKALGVHKAWNRTIHDVVVPPPGLPPNVSPTFSSNNNSNPDDQGRRQEAWLAHFPAGSINPNNKSAPPGGFGFYVHGPADFHSKLKTLAARTGGWEVVMGYEAMFEQGWEWALGGKLPGVYGGSGDSAYGCTGGRQTDRCRCFNLRLMWRQGGQGELYTYLPNNPANTASLRSIPPKSIQHPDYGFSVGRGAWTFQPGRWTAVAERVKVNTIGNADGEIEVFIDGRSVILAKGLILRDEEAPDSHVQGLHFQTFFGGHLPEWASPKDQNAWFTSISGAILDPETASTGVHGHDEL
ncbi:hypothetical protein BDY19DRAFT_905074 [Irpex rosettiformis]|uniref:Uncharacterized protein n=1 Tax=Irpex rosettiformis TaxID=378272 RepID=A0ACB8U9D9_9APHY|nr:hypothetical protein BDY19DRAFT_905074 [Irpex rosettiformis]